MYYRFPPEYKNASLETSKFDSQFDAAIAWFKNPEHKNNLIIQGPCGTGKSYLIHAVINSIIKNKKLPISEMRDRTTNELKYNYCELSGLFFGTMKEVMSIIRDSWKPYNEREHYLDIDHLKNVGMLIIDEIGVQYGSESERIELHDILDHRRNWQKPTVAITNARDEDVAKLIGARNFSRLYGGATIVRVSGADKRNIKE